MSRWFWLVLFVITVSSAILVLKMKKNPSAKDEVHSNRSEEAEAVTPFAAPPAPAQNDVDREAEAPLKASSGPLGDRITPERTPSPGEKEPRKSAAAPEPAYAPPPVSNSFPEYTAPPPPQNFANEGDPFAPQPGNPPPPSSQMDPDYGGSGLGGSENFNNNVYPPPQNYANGENPNAYYDPNQPQGPPPPPPPANLEDGSGYEGAPTPPPAPQIPMPEDY